jgi:DNA-binding response OmpR family regulator
MAAAVAPGGSPPAEPRPVVLLVEDDPAARALLARATGAEGFASMEAATGATALALVRARPVDVVVLDLGLPDRDGFAVLRDIRRATRAPTIVVTGDARLGSRVAGLRLGADDFLVKPVPFAEIGARIAAAVRRAHAPPVDAVRFGPFTLDLRAQELRRGTTTVPLRPRERALLLHLARHPRQVLDRAQLLDAVWADAFVGDATVTEHVRTLRRQLGDHPTRPRWIVTVRGVGYRFDP